jgi:hypothetical protein
MVLRMMSVVKQNPLNLLTQTIRIFLICWVSREDTQNVGIVNGMIKYFVIVFQVKCSFVHCIYVAL